MSNQKFALLQEEDPQSFQPQDVFGKGYTAMPQNQPETRVQIEEPTSKIEFEEFNLGNEPFVEQAYKQPSQQRATIPIQPQIPNNPNDNPFENPTDHPFQPGQESSEGLINNENNNAGPPKGVPFYHIEYYQFLFNVNTVQVGHRVLRALVPSADFWQIISVNPDLYGPFWIATTLVFVMAVAGNLHNWLKDGDSAWHYNINKLTIGGAVVYSYLAVLPLCLWGIMRYYDIKIRAVAIYCLWGYSYAIWVPIALLCAIPYEFVPYGLVALALIVSTALLILNFITLFKTNNSIGKGVPILAAIAIFQSAFALTCLLYFFVYN